MLKFINFLQLCTKFHILTRGITMLCDIILAFFAVFGLHSALKVLWYTFVSKIDRSRRKEYNSKDKN